MEENLCFSRTGKSLVAYFCSDAWFYLFPCLYALSAVYKGRADKDLETFNKLLLSFYQTCPNIGLSLQYISFINVASLGCVKTNGFTRSFSE